jgi:hypothetical protein
MRDGTQIALEVLDFGGHLGVSLHQLLDAPRAMKDGRVIQPSDFLPICERENLVCSLARYITT